MNKQEKKLIKVLLIDDSKTAYLLIKNYFGEFNDKNFQLDWIDNFNQALSAVCENKYDIFLVDYWLGEKNGLDFIRQASKFSCDAPTILLTGDENKVVDAEARQVGAADYLIKGQINPQILERSILYALEHTRATKALRESEHRYRHLIETLPVMFYSVEFDPPYKPIYVSPTFASLGYPLEDWTEKENMWMDVLHPEDREWVLRETAAARLENRETDYKYRLLAKDGRTIWIHDRGQFVKNRDGQTVSWQGVFLDITEAQEAEKARKKSEEKFRDLFENANDIVYVHDLAGNFLSINKAGNKTFGYEKEDLTKLNISRIVAPEDLEMVRQQILKKNDQNVQTSYETKCLTKDGKQLILEINSRGIYENGKIVAVQGIARDITERKQAEANLIESEEKFRDLFENAHDIVYVHDLEGNFTSLNRAGEKITGYTREEAAKLNFKEIVAPEYLRIVTDRIERKINGEIMPSYEVEIFSKQHWRIALELNSRVIYKDGKPVGIQGIARDITERKRAEEERDRFYKLTLDLLTTVNFNDELVQVNPAWEKILGYQKQELLDRSFFDFIHPKDIRVARAETSKIMSGYPGAFEVRMLCKDESYRWILWSTIPVLNDQSFYAVGRDITERKKTEKQLKHNALYDTLTNLPNRAQFMNHLKEAIEDTKRNADNKFAVLFLDLDRFKVINDGLGHLIGDKLLIAIAERLKSTLRPGDIAARLGGDEFTFLINNINDKTDAVKVAERLQKKLAIPFKLDSYEVFTSASVGIIISDEIHRNPEDFLRDADAAMYRAKETGKARYEIFDREMHIRNMNLLQVETDLRHALERSEFRVYFQPIVALDTGTIQEFEALIRWEHPKYGLISPNEFIGVAEETGLIIQIGEWILEESCRQTKIWHEKFPSLKPLGISVNLSAKQLMHPALTSRVKDILVRTDFSSQHLKLEVTESTVMENSETALKVLTELTDAGIKISTDDFGTGYSSLSYLHRFPFERIKIDRSFVSKMDADLKSEAIVRTILMLGKNLEINIVAEGIENEHQLWQLRSFGCQFGQGYLFSKPVDAEYAEKLLTEGLPLDFAEMEKPFNFSEIQTKSFIEVSEIQ